jgi:dTDP-4-amino-4,6-dideoxygalactose transaminase
MANSGERKTASIIPVTRPFLPELDLFLTYIRKIWSTNILTNNGPLTRKLESDLAEKLGNPNFNLVSNGTLGLQIALRALDLQGDVITTPFTYVATATSILWERCRPIFVDVDEDSLCLDSKKIETAITPRTVAILPVHVYGIPCDVHAIAKIAAQHRLKVIYDSAHAFDLKIEGRAVADFGDVNCFSFHATKLFHTVEGGAVTCRDPSVSERIYRLKSFGHLADDYYEVGINAKMSEIHSAMGLAVLPQFGKIKESRRRVCGAYDERLKGIAIRKPKSSIAFESNYSYYPVLFSDGATRDRIFNKLREENIHGRKYFWPSLNTLPYLNPTACPVSESAAQRVLCLPLYVGLEEETIDLVCRTIQRNL